VISAARKDAGLGSRPAYNPPVQAFYSDRFVLPLPPGHRFPMAKYRKLRERVRAELRGVALLEPDAASLDELALAHAPEYIGRVLQGALDPAEVRAIGFPWSAAMVERSRRSVGATLAACRAARLDGVAVNLAGGTHHAQRARGAGYCVFNDAAIAVRAMQADAAREGLALTVAIIDLDVHQGDGTAQILGGDASVFTLSMHGASNFPFRKQLSDLDVALPDGTGDATYLMALDDALDCLRKRFTPQFFIYLAGADAHEGDRLGKLALSTEGMVERDRRVFAFAAEFNAPIAVAMAGGYGRDLAITVDVHFRTVHQAHAAWAERREKVESLRTARG
jgi:acetoin utilization deacetylase AcuC-like enzyme